MKSVPAIAFEYRPSRWLAAAIAAVWMLALFAVVLSGLGVWVRLMLAAVASAYAVVALRRFLFRPPARRVAWHAAGHWRVQTCDGEEPDGVEPDGIEHVVELQRAVVVGPLIVLGLRGPAGAITLPLLPDNCAADIHRLLRVRLAKVQGDIPGV